MNNVIQFPKKNGRLEYLESYEKAVTLTKNFAYMRELLRRLREESFYYNPSPKSRLDEHETKD